MLNGMKILRVFRAALATTILVSSLGAHAFGQIADLEQQAFQQAVALADPSIVRIETIGGLDVVGEQLIGTGPTTGVVVSEDGYIITSSFNFANRPASVLVTMPDGRRFAAEEVAGDKSKMLTLLKIELTGMTPIQAASKGELRVGQWALALGRTYDNAFPSVSVGLISALDRIWGRAVQTDAKVSPVNYGGPLVDIEGRAIGVLVPLSPRGAGGETAGVEWYDGGIGFAIPMDDVYAVLDRLRSGETLREGKMGVRFANMGPLAGEAVIDRVQPLSPADEAGLKAGDRIITADGKPIGRIPHLQHVLGAKYAGETIALTVKRDEETLEFEFELVAEVPPYERPFLGILPRRDAMDANGVELRHVFADSPAATANLLRGDIITGIEGESITDAATLRDRVSRIEVGTTVRVAIERNGAPGEVHLDLASMPETIPADLPTSNIPAADPPLGEDVKTGRFTTTLPGDTAEFWAYVPASYNPDHKYALLVWLHPAGDTQEAAMMRLWQTQCDRRGIIMVGPKAGNLAGWTPGEAEFVRAVVEHFSSEYTIDPTRVVAHGHGQGGRFAWHVGFKHRDLFTGIAPSSAILRQPPPDNDPNLPQQLLVVCGQQDPLHAPISQIVAALQKLKFPTTFLSLESHGENYAGEDTVDAIARWIDMLDRI